MRNALVRFACVAAIAGVAACQAFLSFGDQVVVVFAEAGAPASPDGGVDSARGVDGSSNADGAVGELVDAGPPRKLEVIATAQAQPQTLALNTGYAYWANVRGGTIGVYAKDAGTSLIDAGVAPNATSGDRPQYVAADEGAVYWMLPTGGQFFIAGIRKADVDGGAARDLLTGHPTTDTVNGFTQHGPYVYWTTSGAKRAVMRAAKTDGAWAYVTGLNQDLPYPPGPIVATNDALFWTLPAGPEISRSALAGMDMKTDNTPATPTSLAADDRFVFFIASGKIWRRDAATLDNELPFTSDADAVELATHADYLYWTFAANGSGGVRRMRADLPQGTPEILHDQLPGAHWIAVDDSGVYFTRDNGDVCRLVP